MPISGTWTVLLDLQQGSGYQDVSALVREKSFQKTETLHRKYKPSQDKCKIVLDFDSALANDLLNAPTAQILVDINVDGSDWFQGASRPIQDITVSNEDNTITLDVTDNSYLLKKQYGDAKNYDGLKVCDPGDTANSIVHQVLIDAGYTLADIGTVPTITQAVLSLGTVQDDTTYWSVLETLLFDYGYVFYFDEDGIFQAYEWIQTTITPTGSIDNDDFVDKIDFKLSDEDFDTIVLSYNGQGVKADRVLGYIGIPGASWPSQPAWDSDSGPGDIIDRTVNFSDAAITGDPDLQVTGTTNHYWELAPFLGAGPFFTGFPWNFFAGGFADGPWLPYQITGTGAQGIAGTTLSYNVLAVTFYQDRARLRIQNTSNGAWDMHLLARVRADVQFKEDNIRLTAATADAIGKIKKHTATYIYQQADAERLANGLLRTFELSYVRYKWRSETDHPIGQYVTLTQPETGVNTAVRIFTKRTTIKDRYTYQYEAEGVAAVGTFGGVIDSRVTNPVFVDVDGQDTAVPTGIGDTGAGTPALPIHPSSPFDPTDLGTGSDPTGYVDPSSFPDGLYFSSDYIGFITGGEWTVYIADDGTFRFEGDASNFIEWDGSTLTIEGDFVASGNSTLAGTVVTGDGIQSDGFITGQVGWQINGAGDAEFNNVLVRGALEATVDSTIQGIVRDGPLQSQTWVDVNTAGGWQLQVAGDAYLLGDTYFDVIVQRGAGTPSALAFGDIFDSSWTAVQLYRFDDNTTNDQFGANRWDEQVNVRRESIDFIFGSPAGFRSLGGEPDYALLLADHDSGMTFGAGDAWTIAINAKMGQSYTPFRTAEENQPGAGRLILSTANAQSLAGASFLPVSPSTFRATVNALSTAGQSEGVGAGRILAAFRQSSDNTIRVKGADFNGAAGTWSRSTGDLSLGTSTVDWVHVVDVAGSSVRWIVVWFDTSVNQFKASLVQYNGSTANPTLNDEIDLSAASATAPVSTYQTPHGVVAINLYRYLATWSDGTNLHIVDIPLGNPITSFDAKGAVEIYNDQPEGVDYNAVALCPVSGNHVHLYAWDDDFVFMLMQRFDLGDEGETITLSGAEDTFATITGIKTVDKFFDCFAVTSDVSALVWVESSDSTIKVQFFGHDPTKGTVPQRSAVQSSGVTSNNILAAKRTIDDRIIIIGDGQTTNVEAITARPTYADGQKVTSWTATFGTKTTKAVTNAPDKIAMGIASSQGLPILLDDGTNVLEQWGYCDVAGAGFLVYRENTLDRLTENTTENSMNMQVFSFYDQRDQRSSQVLASSSIAPKAANYFWMRWDGTALRVGMNQTSEQSQFLTLPPTTALRLAIYNPSRSLRDHGLRILWDEILISEAVDLGTGLIQDHFNSQRRWITLDETDPIQAGTALPIIGDVVIDGDLEVRGGITQGAALAMEAKRGMEIIAQSLAGAQYFEVTPGVRRSDDDTEDILEDFGNLTKRIDQAWAVGDANGSMDTGTAPTTGCLHVYVIKRTDTGVTDYLTSDPAVTTPGSPVMPTNYDKKRYIGSLLISAANTLRNVQQKGDDFIMMEDGVLFSTWGNSWTVRQIAAGSFPEGLGWLLAFVGLDGNAGSDANMNYRTRPVGFSGVGAGVQIETRRISGTNYNNDRESGRLLIDDSRQFENIKSSGTASARLRFWGWTDDRMAFTPYHQP